MTQPEVKNRCKNLHNETRERLAHSLTCTVFAVQLTWPLKKKNPPNSSCLLRRRLISEFAEYFFCRHTGNTTGGCSTLHLSRTLKAKIFKSERSLLKPKWSVALASQLIHPLQRSQISLSSRGPPQVVVVVLSSSSSSSSSISGFKRDSLLFLQQSLIRNLSLYLTAIILMCWVVVDREH